MSNTKCTKATGRNIGTLWDARRVIWLPLGQRVIKFNFDVTENPQLGTAIRHVLNCGERPRRGTRETGTCTRVTTTTSDHHGRHSGSAAPLYLTDLKLLRI